MKTMSENFTKIGEIIIQSEIEPVQKEEFLQFLTRFSNEQLAEMLSLIETDPSLIKKLSDNFQAKRAAMVVGDAKLWDTIVEQEVAQLEAIEKQES